MTNILAGRQAGIALVVLLLCVLVHGSARGILHLREVRDFRGRAPVESEVSGHGVVKQNCKRILNCTRAKETTH